MYKPAEPKRRDFFKIATAGTAAAAAGGLPMMFVPNAALAEEALGSEAFKTIVKVARDIFRSYRHSLMYIFIYRS